MGFEGFQVARHGRANPNETWRAWMMTGARQHPIDPRRIQGSHRGVKRILAGSTTSTEVGVPPWKEFTGAMIRQAVNEAMNRLSAEDQQVVKLAYFGGLSNREIAAEMGIAVGAVQRRLRQALAFISEHVEHGRAMGRRAALAVLAGGRIGRWLSDMASPAANHAVVAMALVAAVVAAPLARPAAAPWIPTPLAPAITQPAQGPVQAAPAALPAGAQPAAPPAPAAPPGVRVPPVSAPVPALPVALPSVPPVRLPKLPSAKSPV